MFNDINVKGTIVKKVINKFIPAIGAIRDLEIDKSKKRIVAQVDLNGEILPVRIEFVDYNLSTDSVTISQFICDKPWIETTLNKFVAKKKIRLHSNAIALAVIKAIM